MLQYMLKFAEMCEWNDSECVCSLFVVFTLNVFNSGQQLVLVYQEEKDGGNTETIVYL